MKSTFFLLLLLIAGVANATDYYVSATGNDANNGTSQTTPWKTLAKVESVCNNGTIHAGDRILFKCGDTFTGKWSIGSVWGNNARSGTATSPITLSSYGTGAKPVMLYPTGGSTASEGRMLMFFCGIDYWVIDGLNFTDLDASNNHVTPANCGVPMYLGASGDGTCNHWVIQNVDISLCGMGVVLIGDANTVQNCNFSNFKNLKSTPNTGGSSAYEDYGANPFTIIDGNDNQILNNYVSGGWAESLDFGYNGGFCEMYGACNRNQFMYNTIVDCNGLSEFGGNGNNTDNLYAYNKLIDNGAMFWVNSSCQAINIQFFNNTVIETPNSRFAQGSPNAGAGVVSPEALSHLNVDVNMFSYSGQNAATVFNLKNNLIQISNPLKIAKSNESKMAHDYNVVKLSGGSAFGPALNTHDKSTSAVIFTNTTPASPASWNLLPPAGSPPIDAGTNVGIAEDFVGNPVPAVPNAGILESATSPSSLAATSILVGTIACNGGTATVTVSATGGTAPYTGTGTFTVSAGTYTYTVTDAAGTSRTTSITVTQPTAVSATLSSGTIVTYGGTTTLTVSASGGTSGYTYKLNSGSYQSSATFTSVAAGTHTVTIKDANGCTITKTITITQPAAPNPLTASAASSGAISCNGSTTTITVSATGGTTPYTGTGSFTVGAGTYTYTVTDAAGQTATTSVTVSQPAALTLVLSAGTITVNGGTTTLTATSTGGTAPYTYKLNSGSYQSSATFTGVAAGTHTVTVKDKLGCTTTQTIVITQPGAPGAVVVSSTVGAAINCNGGTTTVTVTATGGTAPYTGTGTFTVGAGTYNYTVTDAAGATGTTSVTITQPAALNLTVTAGTITVNGGTTTVTATCTGGAGSNNYKLDNGSYQSSGSFTGVAAGTHTVTVRDKNSCTASQTITITQPGAPSTLAVTATAGTISCNGATTTVTVSATGGTTPYTGTGSFTAGAGPHTYTVTDAAGTVRTATVTISQPSAIVPSATAGTISVAGGTTTITAGATGGTAPYTYKLNSGSYQSSTTFSNVAAGTHTITVKDANGCTATKSITITQPSTGVFKLNLVSKSNESCKGKKDGKITVICTGGTAPYQYRINFGAYSSNNVFTNLRPGFYIVTGKSATGATSTLYIIISSSNVTCPGSGKSENENLITGNKTTGEGTLKINVYPNPTTTEFSLVIEKGSQEDAHIFVTNVNGQPVYQGRGKSFDKINFGRNFTAGIYIVKVVQGKTVQTLKVIKIN